MANQLGFASFRELLDSPSEQPVLLVVDNCEHVLDDAAEAVDALLGACLAPVVVATSRSPLDLPGESVVVLGPLAHSGPTGASVDLFRDLTVPDVVRRVQEFREMTTFEHELERV